jgi:rubrerythrin
MGRHLTRTAPAAALAAALATTLAVTGCSSSSSTTTTTSSGATTSVPASAATVSAGTKTNVLKAMHGEAFARAAYLAYGAQARTEGKAKAATLFEQTAEVERGDHFRLEAGIVGLVGTDAANLSDAISGENYETTTMYPQFAAQAKAEGDTAAATLFTEIAADEAAHRDLLTKAKAALSGTGQVPKPPAVTPVVVPAGAAKSKGTTLANLQTAMHGEAFASAKYLLYADKARADGHPDVADLFTALSEVEMKEHWAGEAVLAGQVSTTSANLSTAATGENYEATQMYPDYAAQAKTAGDTKASTTLTEIAADEAKHRDAFLAERQSLATS